MGVLSAGYIKAIAAAALAAFLFGAGWMVNGWRWDAKLAELRSTHSETLTTIATKTREAADAVRTFERQVALSLAAADAKHTGELNAQKAETQRLRDCVRAGTCGVRVITRYVDQPVDARSADAASGSVGSDAVTLDGPVSERVLDLRDSIAEDEAKLAYLRSYAEQCRQPAEVN